MSPRVSLEIGPTYTTRSQASGAGNFDRSAEIVPRGKFFPIGMVAGAKSPCASKLRFASRISQRHAAFVNGDSPKLATSTGTSNLSAVVKVRFVSLASGTRGLQNFLNSGACV